MADSHPADRCPARYASMPDLHANTHACLIAEPLHTMPDLAQSWKKGSHACGGFLSSSDTARSCDIWRECRTSAPHLLALVARFLSRSKLVTGDIRRSVLGALPVMGGRSVVGTLPVVGVLLGDAGHAPPWVLPAAMPVVSPVLTRTRLSRTRFSLSVSGFWCLPIVWPPDRRRSPLHLRSGDLLDGPH